MHTLPCVLGPSCAAALVLIRAAVPPLRAGGSAWRKHRREAPQGWVCWRRKQTPSVPGRAPAWLKGRFPQVPVKEQSLCIPDPRGKGERNSFFCSSHPVSKRAENDTRCLLVKAQELISSSRNSAWRKTLAEQRGHLPAPITTVA